ncbi:MAG: GNAT family N-acetyltransferase [Rhodopila sp.]
MADNAIATNQVSVRPLQRNDLEAVIAVDQAQSGHSRRDYFTRRLDHAARDPAAFAGFAAECGGRFAGVVFARIEEGEFGGSVREASLDAIGVSAEGQGVGRALIDRLAADLRGRGIRELATQVDWTNHHLTGFFSSTGFIPAPRIVLERDTATRLDPEETSTEGSGDDRPQVRSMQPGDLPALIAIDRRVTGEERPAYYARKLEEVFSESGVRVSLVAEIDRHPAGFIVARVDFGEFGHTEPKAVMDTIGVDPRHSREGVGAALLSQLVGNLGALRAESLRTEVTWNRFNLLGFLDRMGFRPHRRLALQLDLT